jgi:hypothetical protein
VLHDPLGRTIDTLCAPHINVEKLDSTVIIADCNARLRATLIWTSRAEGSEEDGVVARAGQDAIVLP